MGPLYHTGNYILMLTKTIRKPERFSIFWQRLTREVHAMGVGSLPLVIVISLFIGAVIVIQTASNIDSAFIPKYLIGFTTRQSMVLEFSSTVIGLILIGKVGSSVATELGTMRITEQIDALEIMGVNSRSFLILPKIIALVFMNPILMIFSIFVGLIAGYWVGDITGLCPGEQYFIGLKYSFKSYEVFYAIIKALAFGFIIASVPAYFGYHVKGGALDVSKASTNAVVYTSILLLLLNYLITQLMLL